MKSWKKCLLAATAVLGFAVPAYAYTPPTVPPEIFEWVQSSPRMNYFFNKQMIHYGVTKDGVIDLNILVVPVLKTYDAIQIEDVVQKRRWRMLSVEEYAELAGEANYIRIDLAKRQVIIDKVEMLDYHFSTIEQTTPGQVVELASLSPKSRDAIFYQGIIDYCAKNRPDIVKLTKGTLSKEDQKLIEKEQKEMEKARHEEEKRLEKERREKEKQEEKARKEKEKQLEKECKEKERREKEQREKEQEEKARAKESAASNAGA
ncbi:MAG: hypothetical protein IJS96_07280 [Schwartzia sp.]|nr:hypothetical protein [Schwartzia sp. (in: firmicutes)]